MKKIKLNIGCGLHHWAGFINIDKYITKEMLLKEIERDTQNAKIITIEEGSEFVHADVLDLPFPNDYADLIETVDMVEHLPIRDVYKGIKEMHRVLKPGGTLRIMTPNFNDIAQRWVDEIKGKPFNGDNFMEQAEVVYGNQLDEGNYHKVPITPEVMDFMLKYAGFEKGNIDLYPRGSTKFPPLETQGENPDGSFLRTGYIYVEVIK